MLNYRDLRDHLTADLADAEISKLGCSVLVDQDVRRFDIAVDHIPLMGVRERLDQRQPPLLGEVVPAQFPSEGKTPSRFLSIQGITR